LPLSSLLFAHSPYALTEKAELAYRFLPMSATGSRAHPSSTSLAPSLPRVTQPSAQHAHCASCAAFAPPFSLPFPCPFHYTRFGANSSLRTLRAHRKSRACLSMPPHEREGLTRPAPSVSLIPPPGHEAWSLLENGKPS